MASEKIITKQITTYLRSQGALVIKIHGGPYQQPGLPDLVCILDGVTMWFEVKTKVGKLTKLQGHCHRQMREHGALIAVVRSVEEVQQLVCDQSNHSLWKIYTK